MIFVSKGNMYLGETQKDKNGNVVKHIPPRFEESEQGSCVAIGKMNSETNEQIGSADVFADWQAAEFLSKILELVSPRRKTNLPDFKKIFSDAYKDRVDFCDYCCDVSQCQNCIVNKWKIEQTEGENQ